MRTPTLIKEPASTALIRRLIGNPILSGRGGGRVGCENASWVCPDYLTGLCLAFDDLSRPGVKQPQLATNGRGDFQFRYLAGPLFGGDEEAALRAEMRDEIVAEAIRAF